METRRNTELYSPLNGSTQGTIRIITDECTKGRNQEFATGGQKRGSRGRKYPAGSRAEPRWGYGALLPEARFLCFPEFL